MKDSTSKGQSGKDDDSRRKTVSVVTLDSLLKQSEDRAVQITTLSALKSSVDPQYAVGNT